MLVVLFSKLRVSKYNFYLRLETNILSKVNQDRFTFRIKNIDTNHKLLTTYMKSALPIILTLRTVFLNDKTIRIIRKKTKKETKNLNLFKEFIFYSDVTIRNKKRTTSTEIVLFKV